MSIAFPDASEGYDKISEDDLRKCLAILRDDREAVEAEIRLVVEQINDRKAQAYLMPKE